MPAMGSYRSSKRSLMVMAAAVQRLLEQIGDLLSGSAGNGMARSVIAYRHLPPERLRSHPGSSPKPYRPDRPRTETAPFTLVDSSEQAERLATMSLQAGEDAATWGARPSTSSIMRSASRTCVRSVCATS